MGRLPTVLRILTDHSDRRNDTRQHRPGYADRVEQIVIPRQGLEIHEQGAAGVRDVGDELTGQIPRDPGVHRAECQFAVFRPRQETVVVIEQPSGLRSGEIGGKRETGPGPKPVRAFVAAETTAEVGGTYVLPDDGVSDGRPGLSRPHERRLSLIGESDGYEIGRRRVDLSERLPDHQVNVPPDLLGIVLNPTRLRIDLLVLSLGHGHDLAAVIDESAS